MIKSSTLSESTASNRCEKEIPQKFETVDPMMTLDQDFRCLCLFVEVDAADEFIPLYILKEIMDTHCTTINR